MPWSQTSPMDQKIQFISHYLRGGLAFVELCEQFGISRKTGYKWLDRYLRQGVEALEDRSRRPRSSPNQTPTAVVNALLETRRKHPSWGAKKLLAFVGRHHPAWDLPHRSTVCDLLKRHGMVPKQRQSRRIGHPGKPQQNGRHERMHRTLKAETTRPPAASMRSQQVKFDNFRQTFNVERPHEALDLRTPASCYEPSPRPMPDKLPPLEYPDRFEVRYVSANGGIRWNRAWVNVSITCVGEYVGLEEVDDGLWNVYFGPLLLGRLHERLRRIEDAFGRIKRHR